MASSPPSSQSTPLAVDCPSQPWSAAAETPVSCLYTPTLEEQSTFTPGSSQTTPLEKMNDFLESKDISPVRYPATSPLSEASKRTRRRHVRKARQAVGAVLEEVAPHQSRALWKALVSSYKSLDEDPSDESDEDSGDVDETLMKALSECYNTAPNWQVQRQILSIVADKISLRTLRRYIPDLTRYHFGIAREHVKRQGKGIPPPKQQHKRMLVSQSKLDHFLDFISSPHIWGEIYTSLNGGTDNCAQCGSPTHSRNDSQTVSLLRR